jgi:hypothetical protein
LMEFPAAVRQQAGQRLYLRFRILEIR